MTSGEEIPAPKRLASMDAYRGFRSPRVWWGALAVILAGFWAAWALYPLPGPEFEYARVGVPPDWPHHATGFAAHWNKNSNLGAAFDQAFLNFFPRAEPFVANSGGYLTLSFIPTLGTMVLGLIAGGWMRSEPEPRRPVRRLALAGVVCLMLGAALHSLGICPVVKRIWTPSWVLFSGGWCFLLLAAFYAVIDWGGRQRWAFPLIVIGMNSIAAYCIAHLIDGCGPPRGPGSLRTTRRPPRSRTKSETWAKRRSGSSASRFAPPSQGAEVLLGIWLNLLWMHRRPPFLKI